MRILAAISGGAALAILAGCVLPEATPEASTGHGAQDFSELCAPCHGHSGTGNGPLAGGLEHPPADLTGLSARNGGSFPMAMVMHKIWGYAGGAAPSAIMPKFGPLMDSPTVLFDAGDGIQTPTPERLVDLANYLTTLQP
jgi:mono/diheme cytochrome c family protein